MKSRREFLKMSVKGLSSVSMASTLAQFYSAPVFAQQATDYRAVVCVFLDGGMDCNDVLIPLDARYGSYAANRPNLALAQSSLNVLQPTSDKSSFGLHPELVKTAALFNSGQAAMVANVGTIARPMRKSDPDYTAALPSTLFSHPAQVGAWESALAASSAGTGWAGRVADTLMSSIGSSKMPAVVSTAGYSLVGQGLSTDQAQAATNTPNSSDLINTLANLQQYFAASENGDSFNNIQKFVSETQRNALTQVKVVSDTYSAGVVQTSFPGTTIGQQLQIVAKLIAGRHSHSTQRQIFIVRHGSFDTHSIQVRALSDKLREFDAAVSSFVDAMKEIGMFNNVTLNTCSDFGRSLVQNSSGGSDHGWGGHHMMIGGSVAGGDVYGKFPTLSPTGVDDTNSLGIWIPTTSMSQYLATLVKWLGVSSSSLSTIFPELPNFASSTIPMLRI